MFIPALQDVHPKHILLVYNCTQCILSVNGLASCKDVHSNQREGHAQDIKQLLGEWMSAQQGCSKREQIEEPSALSTQQQMRTEDLAVTVSPSTSAKAERLRGGTLPAAWLSLVSDSGRLRCCPHS